MNYFFKNKPLSITAFVWFIYFSLLWSRMLVIKDGFLWAGSWHLWADGAAHLTFVSSMAYRSLLMSMHPLFYGIKFNYPFIADLLSALLVKLGLNLFSAYVFIGWILSLVFIFAFLKFQHRFLKNKLAASFGLWIFLLNGAFGFTVFIQDSLSNGLISTLTNLPRFYTYFPEQGIEFLNMINSQFLPQRAFLLGLPVGLYLLHLLNKILSDSNWPGKLSLIVGGILTGLLPLIHPHTLIVIFVVSLWVFFSTIQKQAWISRWLLFVVPAVTIGLPLIIFISSSTITSGFIRLTTGWLAQKHGLSILKFWITNWGPLLITTVLGYFHLTKNQRRFSHPFIFLFFLSNFVLFQPHDWDNSKIFTWVYLIFSGISGIYLVKLFKSSSIKKFFLALLLFFLLTFSGLLDSIRLLQFNNVSMVMYSPEELALAEQVKTASPKQSIFLSSDKHNHWLPNLTGRQILMGYRGWLWTYGIDYSQREAHIRSIYRGGDQALDLIDHYGIDYIVIGPSERTDFDADQNFFAKNFSIFIDTQNYQIYQVNQ